MLSNVATSVLRMSEKLVQIVFVRRFSSTVVWFFQRIWFSCVWNWNFYIINSHSTLLFASSFLFLYSIFTDFQSCGFKIITYINPLVYIDRSSVNCRYIDGNFRHHAYNVYHGFMIAVLSTNRPITLLNQQIVHWCNHDFSFQSLPTRLHL